MKGRKLFITTRDDFSGRGVLRLPEIRDQYERAPDPKQLVILERSVRAQGRAGPLPPMEQVGIWAHRLVSGRTGWCLGAQAGILHRWR